MKVSLQALNPNIPGKAILNIEDWDGSSDIEMSVQRSQGRVYFQERGLPWNTAETWLVIPNLSQQGTTVSGIVEEWFVDELLTQPPNVVFRVVVRERSNPDLKAVSTLTIDPDIQTSSALGSNIIDDNVIVTPTALSPVVNEMVNEPPVQAFTDTSEAETTSEPEVIPEPVPEVEPEVVAEPEPEVVPEPEPEVVPEPEPEVEAEPEEEEPTPNKSKKGLWILLALLLIILAGMAAWLFRDKLFGGASNSNPPAPAATQAVCPVTADTPDDASSFFEQTCTIKQVETLSTDEVFNLLNTANQYGKCEIARRLYNYKAEQETQFALSYAKALANGDGQCFPQDKETAKFWYESVLDKDPNNAEAKQQLEELNK